MTLRALIVDDERPARQRVEDLLAGDSDINLAGSFADGSEAVAGILTLKPNILFLDIQMPGLNGFDVLRQVGPEHIPVVIFITAYDQYALSAFELCALDYLLKPFEDQRFFQTLQRAKHQAKLAELEDLHQPLKKLLNLVGANQPQVTRHFLDRIPVKTHSEVLLLDVTRIAYIAAQGPYLEIHVDHKTYLIRKRMIELEQQLDPRHFFRIHRSTLVNLHFVRSLVPLFREDYAVALRDGTRLRLSRSRREALQKHLGMGF